MSKSQLTISWHPNACKDPQFMSFQAYHLTPLSAFTLAIVYIKEEQDLDEAEKMLESVKMLHLYHHDLFKSKKPSLYILLRSIQDHLKEKYSFRDLPFFLIHATAKGRIYIFQLSSSFLCWHQRKNRIFHLQQPGFLQRKSLQWKKITLDDEKDSPFFAFRCILKQNDKLLLTHHCVPVMKNKKQLRKLKTKLLSGNTQIIGKITL